MASSASKASKVKKSSNNRGTNKPKSKKRQVSAGIAVIIATFNNTIISITDLDGNLLGQSSAGAQGFKGSRKNTPYAAQVAAKFIAQKIKEEHGMQEIHVRIKGPGPGRDISCTAMDEFFKVSSITEATRVPHNGVRESKERRV